MNKYVNKKSLILVYTIGFINKVVKSIWYKYDDNIVYGILEGVLSGILWPTNEKHYVKWSDIIYNEDKELIRLRWRLNYWILVDKQHGDFDDEIQEATIIYETYKSDIPRL